MFKVVLYASLKKKNFIRIMPVSKKKLITVSSVYIEHTPFCTVHICHALGTVSLAEFPLFSMSDLEICPRYQHVVLILDNYHHI